jgi:hypothetical protein
MHHCKRNHSCRGETPHKKDESQQRHVDRNPALRRLNPSTPEEHAKQYSETGRVAPTWALGECFVVVANISMPYQQMRTPRCACHPPAAAAQVQQDKAAKRLQYRTYSSFFDRCAACLRQRRGMSDHRFKRNEAHLLSLKALKQPCKLYYMLVAQTVKLSK